MALIPLAIYWCLVLWGLLSRGPALLYVFCASIPLAAMASVPTGFVGGLTLLPQTMTALLIAVKMLGNWRGIDFFVDQAVRPGRGMLLVLFWIVAVLSTFAMPRLLDGAVVISPLGGSASTGLLHPSRQNFTQLAYLSVSVFAVFGFARLLSTPEVRAHLLRAWMLGSGVAVLSGCLDLAGTVLPLDPLLDAFRTANYTMLTGVTIGIDIKRVVGLTSEASAYGTVTIVFLAGLYFMRDLARSAGERRLANLLVVLLVIFTVLSTSSAAYVGLAAFGGVVFLQWLLAVFREASGQERRPGTVPALLGGTMLLLSLFFYAGMSPKSFDPVVERLDLIVFQKATTSSFEERSGWNATSLESLQHSPIFGVGLGATRASNQLIALLSNTGLLGAGLYAAFVITCLVMQVLVGTIADFGVAAAIWWGLLLGIAQPSTGERRPQRSTPGALVRIADGHG